MSFWRILNSSGVCSTRRSFSSSVIPKPYYVTTPIYYTNGLPHLGHVFTSTLADWIARSAAHFEPDRRVVFATGTDEHGIKVQQAAFTAGLPPSVYCDGISSKFREIADSFDVSYTHFTRTTSPAHAQTVHALWHRLMQSGDIYLASFEGWYCANDECFVPSAGVGTYEGYLAAKGLPPAFVSGGSATAAAPKSSSYGAACDSPSTFTSSMSTLPTQGRAALRPDTKVSLESGSPVEWVKEENYKFRLERYGAKLEEWLKGHPEAIQPSFRMNEVLEFLKGGLHDISISRPRHRVHWGIPVPGDPSQSIYVWLDALSNYLTAARGDGSSSVLNATSSGSVEGQNNREGGGGEGVASHLVPASTRNDDPDWWRDAFPAWPADVHVIGKDILRFHAIYWPAFLLSAGLPLPKAILVHGHWTVNRQKMSKSIGNVIDPLQFLTPNAAPSSGTVTGVLPVSPSGGALQPGTGTGALPVSTPAAGGALQRHSSCALRYFLLREGAISSDGDFSAEQLEHRCTAECADTLGNLASRVLTPNFFPNGRLPLPGCLKNPPESAGASSLLRASWLSDMVAVLNDDERALVQALNDLAGEVRTATHALNPSLALEATMRTLKHANRIFANAEPWKLVPKKKNKVKASSVLETQGVEKAMNVNDSSDAAALRLSALLYVLAETLRISAILLLPTAPRAASRLLDQLGVTKASSSHRSSVASAVLGAMSPQEYSLPTEAHQALILFPKIPPLPPSVGKKGMQVGGGKKITLK